MTGQRRIICAELMALSIWLFLAGSFQLGRAQEIEVLNTSRYLGDKRWEWTIFLQAPTQLLQDIRCVEYRLHPTFRNPVQNVCNPGDPKYPFGYTAVGWGVFEIPVKITFKNGRFRYLSHMLSFEETRVKELLPIKASNTAKELREGWWEWTVFIQGQAEVLDRIACVEYTLHRTFPNPIREVCTRGTGSRGFALTTRGWGTFHIPIRVFLKNGRIQELGHDLRFQRASR